MTRSWKSFWSFARSPIGGVGGSGWRFLSEFESFGTKVVVDGKSLDFLSGSTLDYVREALKQAFKFHNPNVDATCGCGESFSVKEKA